MTLKKKTTKAEDHFKNLNFQKYSCCANDLAVALCEKALASGNPLEFRPMYIGKTK